VSFELLVPSSKKSTSMKTLAQTTIKICELNPNVKSTDFKAFSLITILIVPLIQDLPAIPCPIVKVSVEVSKWRKELIAGMFYLSSGCYA
jgi:hypothetical protein